MSWLTDPRLSPEDLTEEADESPLASILTCQIASALTVRPRHLIWVSRTLTATGRKDDGSNVLAVCICGMRSLVLPGILYPKAIMENGSERSTRTSGSGRDR